MLLRGPYTRQTLSLPVVYSFFRPLQRLCGADCYPYSCSTPLNTELKVPF